MLLDLNRFYGNLVGDIGIKYILESLKDIYSVYFFYKDEENLLKYC